MGDDLEDKLQEEKEYCEEWLARNIYGGNMSKLSIMISVAQINFPQPTFLCKGGI